jgi:hypothetical protein
MYDMYYMNRPVQVTTYFVKLTIEYIFFLHLGPVYRSEIKLMVIKCEIN